MAKIEFSATDNPDGLIELVNALPSRLTDAEYEIVFPSGFLYSTPFPVIAAWSKRVPDTTKITLNVDACQESARRLVQNIGLHDIVEQGMESPSRVVRGSANVPLQPITVGRVTEEILDRVYNMVDDWAGVYRDISSFRTILSELAENILVHSEASSPGYLHARVHRGGQADTCEITFADSGIGILTSYIEGSNEELKRRISGGASALQIALEGMNSSKPREISPGGRSYFGYGLFTVKRLIELNRGRMTFISGEEYITLNRYQSHLGRLAQPWHGTIVALVIDLANPLPLDDVYQEEVNRLIPQDAQTIGRPEFPPGSRPTQIAPPATPEQPAVEQRQEKRVLAVRDFSTALLARETGLAIRAELATLLVDGGVVEVDLDGVEDITPSVADECFGKLAARLGEQKYRTRIIFRGGQPVLHRLIELVVTNRLKTV
jgi:hypothetical protein